MIQQERQPPWKQGSGDRKPLPCVSRHMQRKLGSQRSIQQHSSFERSSLSREQESGVQEQTANIAEKAIPTPHSNLPRVQKETAGTAAQTIPVSDSRCVDSPHMPVVQEHRAGAVQKGDHASYCPDKWCEDSALTAESGHLAARSLQGHATDNPQSAASKKEAVTGEKSKQCLTSSDGHHGTICNPHNMFI